MAPVAEPELELELSAWAFHRTELRRSRRIRERWELACGHTVDVGEPYLYEVGRPRGLVGLVQVAVCEFCAR